MSGVDVITAGPLPPNPAELIESQRMRKLIQWGEKHYDRVIIDTPPGSSRCRRDPARARWSAAW